nr:hypothetical protein [Tanacetum cinerariifolium]
MKLALQARNKFRFVDESCLKEYFSTSEVLSAQWDRCNAMVLTWIMNVVSQDVYIGLVYSKKATIVWKELNETYDKVDGSVVKCSCDASKELGLHQQLMNLMQFLMGLDDCYQPVRSSFLTREPLPKVKDAYIVVSRKESHRGVPESFGVTESKMNATSFVAKSFNSNNSNTNNRRGYNNSNNNTSGNLPSNRGPNPNLNCKHYGKTSHTIDRCFELVGFPSGFKSLNVKTISWGWIIDSGANQHLTVSTIGLEKRERILRTGSESGGLYLFDKNNKCVIGGIPLRFWSDCVLTTVYLINMLPSFIISGKSPFKLVHKKKPNLSQLRCLGCLCFSTILNNSDKPSFRDARFYENVFLFKQKTCNLTDVESTNEVDHLKFFDSKKPQSPNDDGKDTSVMVGSLQPSFDTVDSAQGMYQEGWQSATQVDDQHWSEGNVQSKFKSNSNRR